MIFRSLKERKKGKKERRQGLRLIRVKKGCQTGFWARFRNL